MVDVAKSEEILHHLFGMVESLSIMGCIPPINWLRNSSIVLHDITRTIDIINVLSIIMIQD